MNSPTKARGYSTGIIWQPMVVYLDALAGFTQMEIGENGTREV